ncbi:MAG TPA: Lrp/AsnC family transcriptional regulator, partial [Thermoplasmatales archaeon]|nr:Lrp/AsnC family transcriptional regulator [Thermoplasmatales archaeon]
DKKIIKTINDNCEQGTTKIGRKIGLSHTAVRSRLKRLKRDLIKVNCNVDAEKLGLKLFFICLEARFKNKVINHVKNCPKIISYFDTYGEYNFVILAVAEDTSTMESMIEQCFSFNFTDITKYNVMPIASSSPTHQPIRFYSDEEKNKMKCDFKTSCPNCESFKKNRCTGCPLHKGYKGIL